MTPDRFDHVFVQPSSFDDSLAFYRDALGCTVTFHETTPLLGSGECAPACLAKVV